ncbi:TIM barrel protein [Streptomyces boncukensis]|uniref:TIM barrel protein n=1 Tax=Streptomyces boncukensis TaxID=2711219 RepID=A0A6G4X0H8_9ACTN|nr:TIM barrel protein [Streptomyces boncukensis]NGO70367.1 TIM barrel protein [Streptomyces boncukensis]
MAMAPSPLRTVAGNLCLGSAPDSWGIWFPEDEHQVPHTRFLDELARAGYTWLELGPYGYLPTDPQVLAEQLAVRGLQVSGGTAFGGLHRAELWDPMLAHVRRVAELTAAAGAHHLVLIPPMYRDEKTGEFTEPTELTAEQWAGFGKNADRLGRLLLDEYGIHLVLHPHADSHIQTQPEIERLLNESDSRYTNLCLDTGHVAYGGGDTLDLIRRFGERVGYVHIKQMDPGVLRQVADERLGFGEAVQRGVCVTPPAGVPETGPVIEELARLDAELFVIVEQDLYPCAPDVPLPIAVRTREHLESEGLSGTSRPAPREDRGDGGDGGDGGDRP